MEAAPSTKKCPHCAEQILVEAVKCKHCGSTMGGREPPCRMCGGVIVWGQVSYTPSYAVILGVLFIVGGVIGLPLFGLGLIGIAIGIIMIAAIKEQRPIMKCQQCNAVRAESLAPPAT